MSINRVQRPGRIYHFSINGVDYAAYIWQLGKQFLGRIEGDPQVPHSIGPSPSAARDVLRRWLVARDATK